MTNWYIDTRIKKDILFNQRATYGKRIIEKLSDRLTQKYGKGWSPKNLHHCLCVAETFGKDEIISAVRRQFTWTHLKSLMYIKNELARAFYMEMCHIEHWDTRTLDKKIDGQLYERTAISRKPAEIIARELSQVKEKF